MNHLRRCALTVFAALAVLCSMSFAVAAQERSAVLTGADLTRVVPPDSISGADCAHSDAQCRRCAFWH